MLTCFHSLGSLPKDNDLLNIKHNELASSFAHSLRILGCSLSSPGVLLGLTLCRADNTSSVENSKVDITSERFGWRFTRYRCIIVKNKGEIRVKRVRFCYRVRVCTTVELDRFRNVRIPGQTVEIAPETVRIQRTRVRSTF